MLPSTCRPSIRNIEADELTHRLVEQRQQYVEHNEGEGVDDAGHREGPQRPTVALPEGRAPRGISEAESRLLLHEEREDELYRGYEYRCESGKNAGVKVGV